MSRDIRAGWGCPHLIIEEPVALASDRRSLKIKGPVAGAGSVRILINDSQYVPSTGLDSQAILTSSVAGPFRIQKCSDLVGPDGDVFVVTTGFGSASVRVPTGDSVSLTRIQRALKLSNINNLVSISDENGALSLTESRSAGPSSFIRVSGEAAEVLGFIQTGARGTHVYPPWDLIAREDINPTARQRAVSIVPARYPVFKFPLMGNPTIKVTYSSMPERCPRCGATYVENDYRFDPQGEVLTVENEDLLYQTCLKVILTIQGTNSYDKGYGSRITTRIGRKMVGATTTLIKEDIIQALNQVKTLQATQRKYQTVTSREFLSSVDSVDVRPSAEDPTLFFIDVVVRNGSNKPINLRTVFTVPGTVALAGSNNKSLGVEAAGLPSRRLLLDG